MARLEKDYPKDLRVIYRNFPLIKIHDKSALAARAAASAAEQGKFWEMHDLIFSKQADWTSLSVDQFKDWLIANIAGLGLDKAKFTSALTSAKNVKLVQDSYDNAMQTGIPGTPFLIINGQIWPNNVPMNYSNITAVIKLTELEKKQFASCPQMSIDLKKKYSATLHTNKGDIAIQLFADKAPVAVNSFIFLARNGWFNNVIFHRVVPGFVAQSGDPSGSGFGSPGYAFDNEISPGLKFDKAGVVGMANAGAGSNGSQFFITYGPAPSLSGSYTIFGQVTAGMDVAEKLTPRDPSSGGDLPAGDVIQSVTIEEK